MIAVSLASMTTAAAPHSTLTVILATVLPPIPARLRHLLLTSKPIALLRMALLCPIQIAEGLGIRLDTRSEFLSLVVLGFGDV